MESFGKNFKQIKNDEILHVGEIQVGQYFSKITDDYDTYFKCRIEGLEKYYDDETYRCRVWFSFHGNRIIEGEDTKVNYNRTVIDLPINAHYPFRFIP